MENEDLTIQTCKANNPEAVTQDGHTHPVQIKNKDLPEDAEEEQKADIKGTDKLQRNTSGNPWKNPVKTITL